MSEVAEFDWGEKPPEWWAERAIEAGIRRGSLAPKFVAAKMRGETNTEAARSCGAGGPPNTAGYRLSKSNEVQRLFAMVAAETGSDAGDVDQGEARRILSRLARGSDPSIRIRALESLAKMLEREQEIAAAETFDPIETLDALAVRSPVLAAFLSVEHGLPWPSKVNRHVAFMELDAIRQIIEKHTADTTGAPADALAAASIEASNGKQAPAA